MLAAELTKFAIIPTPTTAPTAPDVDIDPCAELTQTLWSEFGDVPDGHSSHTSAEITDPPYQIHWLSILLQLLEHPSISLVLPSSQASPVTLILSPQVGTHSLGSLGLFGSNPVLH